MNTARKQLLKKVLGDLPLTAEAYWLFRQSGKPPGTRFSLQGLQTNLSGIISQVSPFAEKAKAGKKLFIFATLHYWIEHVTLLGCVLRGMGHEVSLAYLPYFDWFQPLTDRFDVRRQNIYARSVLKPVESLFQVIPFLDSQVPDDDLPDELDAMIRLVAKYDTQYALQIEDVDPASELYCLRLERDRYAAKAALAWLSENRPDVVIVPNGTILENGAIYRVARYLNIPVVTYEFCDQRDRIWLMQNAEVMRQEIDDLWNSRKDLPFRPEQLERVQSLFEARQHGAAWEHFARRWQAVPIQGEEKVKAELGLDDRPIVVMATNVLGDSLTLGRQVFSETMTRWLERTVEYFSRRPDIQVVVRVHPGEVKTRGPSMVDVVHKTLPQLPENIHIVGPRDKTNTYDLIGVAKLGLVYTTTVGMEMAMSGLPVIVAGQTHYRGKGFTLDPDSWMAYFDLIEQVLSQSDKTWLTKEQVERAWHYAYVFFFNLPIPYPWHLVRVWEDYQKRPIADVLNAENRKLYEPVFNYLAGEPLDWSKIADHG
jgi:hypothetical protein